jgi:hypothetical protein
VVVDDAVEAMDEEELDRGSVLRGTNMPRDSSEFIEPLPLSVPHAGRDICGKVGGFATAVMRESSGDGKLDCKWRSSSGSRSRVAHMAQRSQSSTVDATASDSRGAKGIERGDAGNVRREDSAEGDGQN